MCVCVEHMSVNMTCVGSSYSSKKNMQIRNFKIHLFVCHCKVHAKKEPKTTTKNVEIFLFQINFQVAKKKCIYELCAYQMSSFSFHLSSRERRKRISIRVFYSFVFYLFFNLKTFSVPYFKTSSSSS